MSFPGGARTPVPGGRPPHRHGDRSAQYAPDSPRESPHLDTHLSPSLHPSTNSKSVPPASVTWKRVAPPPLTPSWPPRARPRAVRLQGPGWRWPVHCGHGSGRRQREIQTEQTAVEDERGDVQGAVHSGPRAASEAADTQAHPRPPASTPCPPAHLPAGDPRWTQSRTPVGAPASLSPSPGWLSKDRSSTATPLPLGWGQGTAWSTRLAAETPSPDTRLGSAQAAGERQSGCQAGSATPAPLSRNVTLTSSARRGDITFPRAPAWTRGFVWGR